MEKLAICGRTYFNSLLSASFLGTMAMYDARGFKKSLLSVPMFASIPLLTMW